MASQNDDFIVKAHDALVDDEEEKIEGGSTVTDNKSSRSRLSPAEKFPNIDDKKLMRKIDWHLLPLVSVLYLLAYLDRGNIGNAKVEGLAEDLKLHGNQYNVTLTIFFITYSVFEVPSNAVLKMTRPSIWLPIIMIAWGVVMTLMGTVHNYMGLFWARFFLGVAEAGLFPGIAYLLTNWYLRHEYQFRLSLFYSAASIAGAFSGILAFGISKMDGVGGYAGWRWIFILEGLLTVIVAVGSFFFIHDYPLDVKFLNEEERAYIIYKMEHDNNTDTLEGLEDHNLSFFEPEVKEKGFKYFKAAFLDWQVYLQVLVYYGIVAPTYGVALFLPTIIKALGYTSANAQLLSIPIYVAASLVSVVIAYFADRVGKRSPFLILCFFAMTCGFAVCIGYNPLDSPGLIYAGILVAVCGMYAAFPACISWAANNLAGDYKRAIGLGLLIGLGNFGGSFGSNIFRSQDGPHFILGHAICLGFVGLGLISTCIMASTYYLINKKRERDIAAGKYKGFSGKKLAEMGDRNPYFKYRL